VSTLFLAVFVASLFGSLHCAGMCGPFVAFATLRTGKTAPAARSGSWSLQLAYHGGRLVAYSILGAIAGVLGATMNFGGSLVGIGRLAGLSAGVLLVAVGASRILSLAGFRLPTFPGAALVSRVIGKGHARASRWTPLNRSLAIGLLTTLLPCGWLYAFVAVAAGTGSALYGVATLGIFWLGTVPILAGIGAGLGQVLARAGRSFQVATAVVVIGLGLSSIVGRWTLPVTRMTLLRSPASSIEGAVERVKTMLGHPPPRCH
jgi:sulfite exporter TauE/SafE